MISRVAEHAFWLNRYLERVDNLARMLFVNTGFVLDVDLEGVPRWMPLVVVVGEEERFRATHPKSKLDDGDAVQDFLVWNLDNPSSIASSIRVARENARSIREVISLEMWETLNGLWLWIESAQAKRLFQNKRYDFYRHIRDQCVLVQGFGLDTMLQNEAYNFMRLGAALERGAQTARILDVKFHALGPTGQGLETPNEAAQWMAILRSCSAIEPFFKTSGGDLSGPMVAGFLLFDRFFPRSVLRSLERSWNFMKLIRPSSKHPTGANSAQQLKSLLDEVKALEVDKVVAEGLHQRLTWIVDSLADVCETIYHDFFAVPEQEKPGRRRK